MNQFYMTIRQIYAYFNQLHWQFENYDITLKSIPLCCGILALFFGVLKRGHKFQLSNLNPDVIVLFKILFQVPSGDHIDKPNAC